MILLADSGSSKTDWCLTGDGHLTRRFFTKGINPFFQTEEEIADEIRTGLLPQLEVAPLQAVYFYGAGCGFPDKVAILQRVLSRYLPVQQAIEVNSDMLAAARALCGHQPGIACILGTGSNSCMYDGSQVVENVSPLGFILGDEGSGAVLGKLLVADLLKNQLPLELKEKFLQRFDLTPAEIINHVYRKPFPNRFLASFAPFLTKYIDEPSIRVLVLRSFGEFLQRNVMQYDYQQYTVHFTGSIAFHFQELLHQAADEKGIKTGNICQRPMEGLVRYHSSVY